MVWVVLDLSDGDQELQPFLLGLDSGLKRRTALFEALNVLFRFVRLEFGIGSAMVNHLRWVFN